METWTQWFWWLSRQTNQNCVLLEPLATGDKATREQSKDNSAQAKSPSEGNGKDANGSRGDLMDQLMGMGFDERKVKEILAKNPKTRDEALEFILNVESKGQFSGFS